MQALFFDAEKRVVPLPNPRPGPGEALIRVLRAGICNTDLEILKGYMGFRGVLGHEFVGVVEECSNGHLRGERVVGEINCFCHRCVYCQMELPHHCANRTVLGIQGRNGAFAEYLALPEENLHIVPENLRDEIAVFTEPLAAAYRITEQIDIADSDRVIVLGAGKLGQLAAQVLYLQTKNLLCIGKNRWKLELLKELGIPTAHVDVPQERGAADIVVEATGAYDGFARALELVRPEGTIVLKTTIAHPTALDMSLPVINEVRVIGSRCGPFRPALDALALGTIEVGPMITETYELKDASLALDRAAQRDVFKIMIEM